MEQKRISFALLFSLVFAFIYLKLVYEPKYTPAISNNTRQTQETKTTQPEQPTTTSTTVNTSSTTTDLPNINTNTPAINLDALKKGGSTKIVTKLYEAEISNLGGKLISFKLNKYNTQLNINTPVELVDTKNLLFPLTITDENGDDSQVNYQIESTDGVLANQQIIIGESQTVKLTLAGSINNQPIKKTFQFFGDKYDFDLKISNNYALNLPFKLHPSEKMDAYNPRSLIALGEKNKLIHSLENSLEFKTQSAAWIGFGDKYFFSSIISNNQLSEASLTKNTESAFASMKNKDNSYKLYLGPKNKGDLLKTGFELSRAIDLGFFAVVADPLLSLMTIFYNLTGNYGLAVILITLVIKLLLLPLTASSFKSMKAMQAIQPEMAALKERIKDQTVLQQEILKLYQKNGVNPLGGCLPMLLQLPIFFGLLAAFQSSLALRHANFAMWVKDLSAPEHLEIFGMPFPLLTLLFAGSIYLQQLSMPANNMDPAQKKMMLFMPLIFIVMMFIYPVPSALILYYLVSNLISFVQQKLLRDGTTGSAFKATLLSSIGIFIVGFLVTLI